MFEIVRLSVGEFGQLKTARCPRDCKPIPDSRAEMVEDRPRQDDFGGTADLGDFECRVHREVITECARYGEVRRF